MCYDISFASDIESIHDILPAIQIQGELRFDPTFHKLGMSFPTWPIVVNKNNRLELHPFVWGPIPKMLNTPDKVKKQRQMFLNARSEKILEPKTMWTAIRHQRCLVPVTGFYEYREIPGQKNKQAYFIRIKGQKIFFIAGLWTLSNSWDVDKPDKIPTFTIVTREANSVMKQIHNGGANAGRMPMMLTNELAEEWVKPELDDSQIKEILSFSLPSVDLEYWAVNSVRKAHLDDESVIAHVDEIGIPPIEV
ncbi:SOS response-associated peptidase [Chitinophaga ginsengisegetis]|uniref:SOS response-associated peptidase n=1 Tax=Chitinophaga ginsengisegetis TaxID=393003 RepID=UPI000DB946EC|nr:SOS response-associated peptidase family protein [Chitinophaga ginsengisegetis]MDR6565472.1 putative SOS response-associated peptidase YedK [Chitinophaga ginsengisegetis]MDR6645200.1 putative SOS response-associated peptidase YedK [Chitinophaga ginsengisegetis]MDR6652208.1 putative SOS response-associated peptidase YedK [Chitinophaga ginsengisegetis]